MSRKRKADLRLLMVAAFWGLSYYFVDSSLEEVAPLNLNAIRFGIAFLVLGVVFRKNLARINRATLKSSIAIGITLFFAYIGSTYGVKYTTLSNAGFICGLAVVITPVIDSFLYRRMPKKMTLFALILCTVGLAMVSLQESLQVASGDLICLICAIAYALDMVLTERAVKQESVDPVSLGVLELAVVCVLMTACSFLLEVPTLPKSPRIWMFVLFLGVFCSGIAFVVQTVEQQHTTAISAGLIFTMEPIFSAIAAYFLAHEVLTMRGYIGAALMIASIILMELSAEKSSE